MRGLVNPFGHESLTWHDALKMSTPSAFFASDDSMSQSNSAPASSAVTAFLPGMRKWMELIAMPLTTEREMFLTKYDSLLSLRGVNKTDVRCLQSGMEVLLNLRRHKVRQGLYLRAVNKRLSSEIVAAAQLTQFPVDHGQRWDCPGHVNVPEGSSDFHFCVLPDDAPEPRRAIRSELETEEVHEFTPNFTVIEDTDDMTVSDFVAPQPRVTVRRDGQNLVNLGPFNP